MTDRFAALSSEKKGSFNGNWRDGNGRQDSPSGGGGSNDGFRRGAFSSNNGGGGGNSGPNSNNGNNNTANNSNSNKPFSRDGGNNFNSNNNDRPRIRTNDGSTDNTNYNNGPSSTNSTNSPRPNTPGDRPPRGDRPSFGGKFGGKKDGNNNNNNSNPSTPTGGAPPVDYERREFNMSRDSPRNSNNNNNNNNNNGGERRNFDRDNNNNNNRSTDETRDFSALQRGDNNGGGNEGGSNRRNNRSNFNDNNNNNNTPPVNTEVAANNRFMAAAQEYKSSAATSSSASNGPSTNSQDFRSFPRSENNDNNDNNDNDGGNRMNRGGGGMRRNNSRSFRDEEDGGNSNNAGNVRVWSGGNDRDGDGPRDDNRRGGGRFGGDREGGERRFGGDREGGDRRFGGDREGGERRFGGDREGGERRFGGDREGGDRRFGGDRDGGDRRFGGDREGGERRFGGDRDGGDRRFGGDRDGGDRRFGGDRGDRNLVRRPMSDRPLPANTVTNLSRWQHNIVNLIKDPSEEKRETTTTEPNTNDDEKDTSGSSNPATPLTAVAQAQASFATTLGDDVAMGTFRASVLRIVEDYMTSFAKDADKKNAAALATLTAGSISKASYAVYVITSGIAESTSAGQRKQIAALVNAMRTSTKKQAAAASDNEIAAGIDRTANNLPSNVDNVDAVFYSFLEELTKAKNGLPAAALTGKALQIYNDKPQFPVSVESLSAIVDGMGISNSTSWGDAVLGTSSTASTASTTTKPSASSSSSSSAVADSGETLTPISEVAEHIVNTSLTGSDIVSHAREATTKYSKVESTGALVTAVLKYAQAKFIVDSKCSWLQDNHYGLLLKEFCYGKAKASLAALFAMQGHFQSINFPLGDKGVPIFLRIFECLYDNDIIMEDALRAWRDDIRNTTPGHDRALMQTEPWFEWLDNAEEEDNDDEDNEEEELKDVFKPNNSSRLR